MIRGLNHLTLAVADLDRALAFYRDVLGLTVAATWPTGAYLEAGALWLCLAQDDSHGARAASDYSHIAFDIAESEFSAMAARIAAVAPQRRENRSEGASLYFLDPDGHKLELHVGSLASRLADYRARKPPNITFFR
jgi:catechol 2,3-dioxygenase-like lactoylglutathione lyase family enzyme